MNEKVAVLNGTKRNRISFSHNEKEIKIHNIEMQFKLHFNDSIKDIEDMTEIINTVCDMENGDIASVEQDQTEGISVIFKYKSEYWTYISTIILELLDSVLTHYMMGYKTFEIRSSCFFDIDVSGEPVYPNSLRKYLDAKNKKLEIDSMQYNHYSIMVGDAINEMVWNRTTTEEITMLLNHEKFSIEIFKISGEEAIEYKKIYEVWFSSTEKHIPCVYEILGNGVSKRKTGNYCEDEYDFEPLSDLTAPAVRDYINAMLSYNNMADLSISFKKRISPITVSAIIADLIGKDIITVSHEDWSSGKVIILSGNADNIGVIAEKLLFQYKTTFKCFSILNGKLRVLIDIPYRNVYYEDFLKLK